MKAAKSYPYERPVKKLDPLSQRRYHMHAARLKIMDEQYYKENGNDTHDN